MTEITIRRLVNDLREDDSARAAFADDPQGYFAAHGFDLPDDLLGEAVLNVAATLPPAAAEPLSAFTIAYSPVPAVDPDADLEAAGDLTAMEGLRLMAATPDADSGAPAPDAPDVDGFGEGDVSPPDVDAAPAIVDLFDEAELAAASGPGEPVADPLADLPLDPEPGAAVDLGLLEADDPADLDDLDGFE